MKSLYQPSFNFSAQSIGDRMVCDEENDLHHLLRVSRLEVGEEILFLNGSGVALKAKYLSQEKFKRAEFEILEILTKPRPHQLSIAVGKIKKPQMEDLLVDCVELGIKEVLILDTDYSQRYDLNQRRVQDLLKQAYQQSNHYYELVWKENIKFKDFLQNINGPISYVMLDIGKEKNKISFPNSVDQEIHLMIGPEGGWSGDERSTFHRYQVENQNLGDRNPFLTCTLPTPILRATTAALVATGYLLGKLQK
ncbi:MAG: RsmE family RNA methyltransferase [Bacteriovoracaceae bacterium]|nr:RsmE family RNA methyltransferase [Bacteriovoracaceae bacterium]